MRSLLLGLLLLGGSSLEAQDESTRPTSSLRSYTLSDALITFRTVIDQPAPAAMSKEDLVAYQKQTEWLKSVHTRMETLSGVLSPRDAASGQASGKRQYAPIRITKEWGGFRAAVDAESQQFTTISNVLKFRHDMAMFIIANIK